jgi:MOSC domain-containing protein YiiM
MDEEKGGKGMDEERKETDGLGTEGTGETARLLAVCAGTVRQAPKAPLEEGRIRPGWGLEGDGHAGLGRRPLSLLRIEDVRRTEAESGEGFPPGSLAENLVVEGLPEDCAPGWTLAFPSGALLRVEERGKRPDEPHTYSYKGFCLLPTVGFFLEILEGGTIRPGDPIRVRRA